ncbi:membrane fusion protein, multidrug efflux system [Bryocella elongata]|uniref:Membrane fusion protein, multidrug efflux system n=1 Tax=Bryocella elongata TaxID=863522 RepID=A0A1H5UEZ8_9BACT|nr:efflux RND transporter periplasmic adaptor subunit [Bryocella elongata]SEF73604.1 membrane fusion protein, multidrug efflux system [Bryocella elongata]
MPSDPTSKGPVVAGRIISVATLVCTAVVGMFVIREITDHPRTDDAEVFANYIGMAPLVNGPVTKLYVADNQLVKQGDPLFDIDSRPYAYALARAKSDQETLTGQIGDERRIIAGKASAVDVARATVLSSDASVSRAGAAVDQARADVANATAAVDRANAELDYATNNLHRLEPLLAKQFVTVDQVDQARTLQVSRSQAANQSRSQLALAQAGLQAAQAQYKQAQAIVSQSQQQVQQASHNVTTLDPLEGQLMGRQAAIDTAQYNFDNTHVVAPFDARVTNLTISQGAYATAGQHVFTLIDTRVWWVIANFRETQLHHIQQGMKADVYVLSRPNVRFSGVVDSVGFGVTPDTDLIGKITSPGLPDVQRTLNWVHLASRFPVRVRIDSPASELFRLGESAVVVIRGEASENSEKGK